jgi:hypothetical protein
MRQLGITPPGGILIIETKAEQIHTDAISVLQLEKVRHNLACG